KEKVLLVEAQAHGQILNEEELAFLADPRIPEDQATQTVITHNAGYQADDLEERITRTKRSKNSQKPTRNERDKNKSEESAKDQSRISPTQQERQSKVKGMKSKDQE
ncbi:hypothetical protein Tco_0037545, partial [Tanacetum coccineum]